MMVGSTIFVARSGLLASLIAVGMAVCAMTAAAQPAPAKMPASARLALPGERHAWLNPLVGTWAVEMRVYPGPGAQPIVSRDLRATRTWILGGRYLREELVGTFAGNPSNRIMTLGYNNLDERFELVSQDTFEPGQMFYVSRGGETANRFSLEGESTEAGQGVEPTGRKRDLRFEFEITPTGSVERIFVKYPAQPEFLFVEQIFSPKRDR